MRATWEALHRSLRRSIGTWQAQKEFNEEKVRREILRRFDNPAALVSFLTTGKDDLDDKDLVLAALVWWIQDSGGSDLATSLLWLGLWPGLDNLYGRLRRFFPRDPDALVSEIGTHFTAATHRLDLTRVERVAVTLIRNLERRFHYERQTCKKAAALESKLPEDDEEEAISTHPGKYKPSRLGLPSGMDPDKEMAAIRELLVAEIGHDADLVVAVVLLDEYQSTASRRMGLSHAAVRKRVQRALAQLRKSVKSEK